MLVAVLPPDKLERTRLFRLGANATLVVSQDQEGTWRRTFEVRELPALFILNPSGETVWRCSGSIDGASLTNALNEHLVVGGRLRQRQLRIAAQKGAPAPDFLFEYARERWMALHNLRGRSVLLVFWTAWSKPSIVELQFLQKRKSDYSRDGLVILAINDGDNRDIASDIFEKHRFTHQLVMDRERQISRRYAINCWPTTIAVDESGLVTNIHFGLTPEEEHFLRGA